MRQQLFAPCVDQVVKTVGVGQGYSRAVTVEVQREQPTFADQRHIVASITGLLDKALVMLGEATARVEQLTGEAKPLERTRAEGVVLELVGRQVA